MKLYGPQLCPCTTTGGSLKLYCIPPNPTHPPLHSSIIKLNKAWTKEKLLSTSSSFSYIHTYIWALLSRKWEKCKLVERKNKFAENCANWVQRDDYFLPGFPSRILVGRRISIKKGQLQTFTALISRIYIYPTLQRTKSTLAAVPSSRVESIQDCPSHPYSTNITFI